MLETVTSPDGVTIAFERSGSGPALVIVNGALSTRATGGPLAAAAGRGLHAVSL